MHLTIKMLPASYFDIRACGTPVGKIMLRRTEPECRRFSLGTQFREAFYLLCSPLCFCLWVYEVGLAFQCWRRRPLGRGGRRPGAAGLGLLLLSQQPSYPGAGEEPSRRLLPVGNVPKLQISLQLNLKVDGQWHHEG